MERIIQKINALSGEYHAHDIFQDWVQMMAIAINNQIYFDKKLEDRYINLTKKYSQNQLNLFCEMNGILVELMENKIDDYLGKIYMGLNASSSKTGQFFTPFHVCEMMARVSLANYDGKEFCLNEPSCGGSANVLAIAKVMKEKEYDYQNLLKVVAQDLDFKCVFMSYVQLSICGISAKVIQGNTLTEEHNMVLYTPMYVLKGRWAK